MASPTGFPSLSSGQVHLSFFGVPNRIPFTSFRASSPIRLDQPGYLGSRGKGRGAIDELVVTFIKIYPRNIAIEIWNDGRLIHRDDCDQIKLPEPLAASTGTKVTKPL